MRNKIAILFLSVLVVCAFAFWNNGDPNFKKVDRQEKLYDIPSENTANVISTNKNVYISSDLNLEGSKISGDIVIGPEVAVTGLSGFYDYQFNGNQHHYILRSSPTMMHAIYMTNADSLGPYPSVPNRRTKYALSTDDGATWSDLGEAPTNIRSGYCSLTDKSDGTAVIGNHYAGSTTTLNGYANYDLAPGIGSFSGVEFTHKNAVWPLVVRTGNGNIAYLGVTYQGSAATDTLGFGVFNTTTNTFQNIFKTTYLTPTTEEGNAALGLAANSSGKVVALLNPYRETGGNWAGSRVFTMTSNDNGATWGSAVQIFNPHIVLGDSAVPNANGACDVILDNAGNSYSAWNSLGNTGFFANARLYVIKNGEEPTLVSGAGNSPRHPIPQSVTTMAAQSFFSSFDHPCLAISEDQQYLFCTYSVTFQNDTLNGFNKAHIFLSYAKLSDMNWSDPISINDTTGTTYDQRYASINKVAFNANGYTLYLTYQKDIQPGSYCTANADHSFISRASLIFRKLTFVVPIGVKDPSAIVKEYSLEQNYPNPFNPSTTISYNIPVGGFVTLKIYDVAGNEVRTLVNEKQNSGSKSVTFDGTNLASGIYFFKISVNDYTSTKKMILVK